MRLGFAVKPLARPELKSYDSRRWQNNPHLSVSLAYLRDIFYYLDAARISMYRFAADLAPYATHALLTRFHGQVQESARELEGAGELARRLGLRLSVHAGQSVVLNSPDPSIAARSAAQISVLGSILDAMQLGPEAVIIAHGGGLYGNPNLALERLALAVDALPRAARARLVFENDDSRFSVYTMLSLHEKSGRPLIFDRLHHCLHNPEGLDVRQALDACLATWPAGVTPKIHWSSPRTEWRDEPVPGELAPHLRLSRWTRHSDYVNPFEFIDFMRIAEGARPFDIMLEARGRDLALLQLRQDLSRYAPDLAQRVC